LRSFAFASHSFLNFATSATNTGCALVAPIGMVVNLFFPFGVKNASFGFELGSHATCQYPESRSMVMKHDASPISLTASSQRTIGKVNGLVTAFSFLYETQRRQVYYDQWRWSWFALAASTIGAPHGPSSSSIIPFSSSFATRSLMTLVSWGPYLGAFTHIGGVSPVST
jgi:hypothetical protein